ncbi:MAG: hypothetical protein ACFB13_05890 [Kiloniellaceae bacterium]
MMMFYCDFWSYEQVKARAKSILLSLQPAQSGSNPGGWSKLPQVHVMPVGTGPWPQDRIDLFAAWIDAGCQEGTPDYVPPTPGPLVPNFIALSKVLTGFDDLDILGNVETLAQIYIDRIVARPGKGGQLDALLAKAEAAGFDSVLNGDGTIAAAFASKAESELLKVITLVWYTATVGGDYGTPQSTQYIQGLEWRAVAAHPMGFANENVPFYWQFKPEGGLYTGLIAWNQPG